MRKKVVFPQPLRPTRPRRSPSSIARLARLSAQDVSIAFERGVTGVLPVGATHGVSLAGWARDHLEAQLDSSLADRIVSELAGVRLAIRPELARRFGASFREALQLHGYVRQALAEDSDADVVVIQPVAMRIAIQGGTLTGLEIAVAIRDARGRFLGWHAVRYLGESQDGPPVSHSDALRRAFADAGEQVARAIAKAR